jgi:hypothetical protein
MPIGAVSSEGSSGESINHFAAIRVRTYGGGSLLMSVHSLDDVIKKVLVPFPMAKQNRIIPTRLVNFKSQRASFQFKTSGPNEFFRIHRIVIFTKVSDTSYPGS